MSAAHRWLPLLALLTGTLAGAQSVAPKQELGSAAVRPEAPLSARDSEFMRLLQQQKDDTEAGKPLAATKPTPRPAPAAARGAAAAAPPTPEVPAGWIDEDMAKIADQQGEGFTESAPPPSPTKTVVFISLSMPDSTLKSLFAAAREREDVLFVVRGWTPPNFTRVLQKVRSLFPDPTLSDVNVVIDPYPFRVYKVAHVPVFLHQRAGGDWHRLTGEITLDGAIEEIDKGNFNRVVGRTFKVVEPDVVEEFQKRADAYDWEKEKKRLIDKTLANAERGAPSVNLPRAERSREFWVDPSITLGSDVVAPDGRVAAKAGTQINPLAYMAFSKSFVAFDPDDTRQVAIAKQWVRDNGPATLLATHLPPVEKGKPTLAQRMGQPVYSLSSALVERMGLVAVPSLVQQQGLVLHIREERP